MSKNIIYCLGAILLGGLFSGCNKMDQEPTNKFTEKVFWSSPDRARLVLNMAYNQMYGHDKVWQDECLTDNMIDFRGTSDMKTIRQGLANSSNNLFRSEWKWIFQGIKTTNVFMDMVDLVPDFDPREKARMKAEIRYIRAFLYFRMTLLWGDIPFFLSDITLEQSREMTRTPQSVVLSQLHSELEAVIPQLPRRENLAAADLGRITNAAAMVLNARIYLFEGNMGQVKTICQQLMENPSVYGAYTLFTNNAQQYGQNYSAYENLFISKYEYNEEVILDYAAVPVSKEWGMGQLAPQSAIGSQVCVKAPTQSLVDAYLKSNGAIWTSSDAAYTGRDPRMGATIVYNGATWKDVNTAGAGTTTTINSKDGNDRWTNDNCSATGYYTRKYFDPAHRTDLRMSNNIIVMRWAEVLLMYAEACQSLGSFTATEWNQTIKPIRTRAGFSGAPLEFSFSHGETMDKVIARERRVELALEGLRYFDLFRMDEQQRSDLLNGSVLGAKFANNSTTNIVVSSYSYSTRDKYWSLPQSEMELSPGLRPNNTGY